MKRKSILFITTNSEMGGGEAQLYYLAKGLKNQGFDISVALPTSGELSEKLTEESIDYILTDTIHFNTKKSWPIISWKGLYKLIKIIVNNKIDLVHIQHYEAIKLGGIAAKLCRVPSLWTCHGFWFTIKGLKGKYLNYVLDKVVTTSNFAKMKLLNGGVISDDKIDVIYSGVPEVFFNQPNQGKEFRKNNGISLNDYIIGMIGRIDPIKRHDIFIEVLSKVVHKFPYVKALIIGGEQLVSKENSILSGLKKRIHELSLQNHIIFIPFQNNPIPAYDALNLMVLASDGETFPNAIIEGMARGIVVVSTACGGPEEIINNNENGILVPKNDPGKMADAITELISQPELQKKYGINSHKTAIEFYTLDKMVNQYIALYSKYLK